MFSFKGEISTISNSPTPLACPYCGHDGTFTPVGSDYRTAHASMPNIGLRQCPNPKCLGVVFVALQGSNPARAIAPPNRISFDKEKIPDKVLQTFEEAVTCHANQCYIAAGMLIRKSMEELCEDQGAKGSNLKERIDSLGSVVILPPEMLEAMHNLRFLGNDAAHVEAKTYDQIGEEETRIGIEATKQLLHAVYQYKNLLSELQNLKKSPH